MVLPSLVIIPLFGILYRLRGAEHKGLSTFGARMLFWTLPLLLAALWLTTPAKAFCAALGAFVGASMGHGDYMIDTPRSYMQMTILTAFRMALYFAWFAPWAICAAILAYPACWLGWKYSNDIPWLWVKKGDSTLEEFIIGCVWGVALVMA